MGCSRGTTGGECSPHPRGNRCVQWSGVLRVLVVMILCVNIDCEDYSKTKQLIFRPKMVGDKDVVLLIVPEVDIDSDQYEDLARHLQSSSPIPLWVCILDDGTGKADDLALEVMIALEDMTVRGLNADSADIFIGGHGRGGDLVASYTSKTPELFRGVILMGTFLKGEFKTSSFPIPVLTMSGDLDGITRLTRVSEVFRTMTEDVESNPGLIYQSPLIILHGCNHALFSSGALSGPMEEHDIDSEGIMADGLQLVANYTNLFMSHTLGFPEMYVDIAKVQFKTEYDKSRDVTKPIQDIRDLTQNKEGISNFIQTAQKWLSGLIGPESQRLRVESYIVGDATDIPPSVLAEGDLSVVVTFSDVLRFQAEEGREIPVEIAARMLSPERIKNALKNTTIFTSYTCKDLNYGSFLTAYNMASPIARSRFDQRHQGIIFHTDLMVQSDVAWKLTQLKVDKKGHELHVTGISYMTPNLKTLGANAGLYYCKILPPDRVSDWIYVEALRRDSSS